MRADDPTGEQILVAPRQTGREYDVDVRDGRLYIHTNDDHVNFRVARADPADPGKWETVIAGSDRVYIRGVTSFARHLVLTERVDRFLGQTGRSILTRLLGVILAALAVQFVADGIRELVAI